MQTGTPEDATAATAAPPIFHRIPELRCSSPVPYIQSKLRNERDASDLSKVAYDFWLSCVTVSLLVFQE